MMEQSKYKYLLHLDGYVAAWRLIAELNMHSVILKQESSTYEYYYTLLRPWVHYVPIKRDLSDLIEKVSWCKNNDASCKQIASNANDFAKRILTRETVLDYCVNIITDYNYNIETDFGTDDVVVKPSVSYNNPSFTMPAKTKVIDRSKIIY